MRCKHTITRRTKQKRIKLKEIKNLKKNKIFAFVFGVYFARAVPFHSKSATFYMLPLNSGGAPVLCAVHVILSESEKFMFHDSLYFLHSSI